MAGRFKVSVASYKLLFEHPFRTSHGLRFGTDAVFLRLERRGMVGYGEAALPPYLEESPQGVFEELYKIDIQSYISVHLEFPECFAPADPLATMPSLRTLISTAYYDLISNELGVPISKLFEGKSKVGRTVPRSLITIGQGDIHDIPLKISQLPGMDAIKVKVGGPQDVELLEAILDLDDRPIFLDGNQGFAKVRSVLDLLAVTGRSRVIGIEQPFGKGAFEEHKELSACIDVPVFADESIQGPDDLERAVGVFAGVNIKLMKCGGLDKANWMIDRARALDLQVMLGCMSESSLGCAAMSQLQRNAHLVDLDGPWLISNDPFEGYTLNNGALVTLGDSGIGVVPNGLLEWQIIGA